MHQPAKLTLIFSNLIWIRQPRYPLRYEYFDDWWTFTLFL